MVKSVPSIVSKKNNSSTEDMEEEKENNVEACNYWTDNIFTFTTHIYCINIILYENIKYISYHLCWVSFATCSTKTGNILYFSRTNRAIRIWVNVIL